MLASRHIKREKASLPVDVRASKTSLLKVPNTPGGGEGGGRLGLFFAGYVPLAFQSLYTIIVFSVANCRPHLGHFGANM